MLSKACKVKIMGNKHLIEYCRNNGINTDKLKACNIEKMGDTFFFVLSKGISYPTMDNDIDSQPDVVLTMEAKGDNFEFAKTDRTARII